MFKEKRKRKEDIHWLISDASFFHSYFNFPFYFSLCVLQLLWLARIFQVYSNIAYLRGAGSSQWDLFFLTWIIFYFFNFFLFSMEKDLHLVVLIWTFWISLVSLWNSGDHLIPRDIIRVSGIQICSAYWIISLVPYLFFFFNVVTRFGKSFITEISGLGGVTEDIWNSLCFLL